MDAVPDSGMTDASTTILYGIGPLTVSRLSGDMYGSDSRPPVTCIIRVGFTVSM